MSSHRPLSSYLAPNTCKLDFSRRHLHSLHKLLTEITQELKQHKAHLLYLRHWAEERRAVPSKEQMPLRWSLTPKDSDNLLSLGKLGFKYIFWLLILWFAVSHPEVVLPLLEKFWKFL